MRRAFPLLALLGLSACAAAATQDAETAGAYAGDFTARGTEPFWAIDVRERTLTLQRPDQAPLVANHAGPKADGQGATWSAAAGGKALAVRLTEAPGCSDGMSDLVYPYAATVILGAETLRGCAFKAGEPPPGPR